MKHRKNKGEKFILSCTIKAKSGWLSSLEIIRNV